MNKERIVLITDCVDVAANEIRATLISELDKLNKNDDVEVEPFVFAKEFSLVNGAFLVRLMADNYIPSRTTFLVVLNALSTDRKDRARIAGVTKNGIRFVGENTGTLSWLFEDFGVKKIFETSRQGLTGKQFISFGGKYIHAPIAAKVASGADLSSFGSYFDPSLISYLKINEGTVVHIDNFGVPKIKALLDKLEEGQKLEIYVNGVRKDIAVFTNSMKSCKDGLLTIYRGSSIGNLAELGFVRKLETAKSLGINIGDVITWKRL